MACPSGGVPGPNKEAAEPAGKRYKCTGYLSVYLQWLGLGPEKVLLSNVMDSGPWLGPTGKLWRYTQKPIRPFISVLK